MKALVKYAFEDGAVDVRDITEPRPGHGEVLIATRAVGVCGSDVHAWRNKQSWEMDLPVALGHESAGVIHSLGEGVTGWAAGDRVVCETAAHICAECAYCRSGRYNLCPFRLGYGAKRDGAFSGYLVAEPRVLHRIPDSVTFEQAAMTEPYCVAFNALVERATVKAGDVVVVQGAGAIGSLAVQVAKLQGASSIVVVGTAADKGRLAKALTFGADHAVELGTDDPIALLKTLGDGIGADVVVDATGVSAALNQSMEFVRPLGSIAKVGWGPQALGYSLDPLVAKAATIYGSFSHTWETWERILSLFASGRLNPDTVLDGVYSLEEWEAGFEAMENGTNIKSVVTFPAPDQKMAVR
ncbi:zinc-dependent alcohol dehydrogenase [Arthrobacter castelli]|uniref:zinc-dependent alcohol dehydrogenase n=1 Tax=Arthrobacter castelli TaxID=271431 RepID=UPI000413DDD1|nr:zinc-binding dehydrogenase [Arthrobacter castelli]